MEVTHRPSADAAEADRRAVVVELWEELGKPPVDAYLLKTIQAQVAAAVANRELGPAALARILADEGAELKHPEIIEIDAEWRQARIDAGANERGLAELSSPVVLTLATAENLIAKLEVARQRHELNQDRQQLAEVRNIASESRRMAESIARNRSTEQTVRVEQAEIVEWLKVWLQTPALFKDWLELRRRSHEFRARFPVQNQ